MPRIYCDRCSDELSTSPSDFTADERVAQRRQLWLRGRGLAFVVHDQKASIDLASHRLHTRGLRTPIGARAGPPRTISPPAMRGRQRKRADAIRRLCCLDRDHS